MTNDERNEKERTLKYLLFGFNECSDKNTPIKKNVEEVLDTYCDDKIYEEEKKGWSVKTDFMIEECFALTLEEFFE